MGLMRSGTCIIMNKMMIKALPIRDLRILIFKEVVNSALLLKIIVTRNCCYQTAWMLVIFRIKI